MAHKINVMTDVKIEVDMPHIPYYCRGNMKKTEDYLKGWVKEFHEFIRDHRSQDPVSLNVERVMEDVCSDCNHGWDTYEEEGKTFCSWCGEEVESGSIISLKEEK